MRGVPGGIDALHEVIVGVPGEVGRATGGLDAIKALARVQAIARGLGLPGDCAVDVGVGAPIDWIRAVDETPRALIAADVGEPPIPALVGEGDLPPVRRRYFVSRP